MLRGHVYERTTQLVRRKVAGNCLNIARTLTTHPIIQFPTSDTLTSASVTADRKLAIPLTKYGKTWQIGPEWLQNKLRDQKNCTLTICLYTIKTQNSLFSLKIIKHTCYRHIWGLYINHRKRSRWSQRPTLTNYLPRWVGTHEKGNTMKLFKFNKDESGAVTVDWVVLAAALVVLAITISSTLKGPINNTVNKIGAKVTEAGSTL